jgi:GNAT superfamily N-acetyltransferase
MTQEQTAGGPPIEIRERRDDERPAELDIFNEAFPPDWRSTLEEMKSWEAMERPEDDVIRLLALVDGQPVGAGRALHSPHRVPGRFEVEIAVRPAHRRHGVGQAIYGRLQTFAVEHGGRELEAGVRVTLLPDVEASFAREGFKETSRMRESELDISGPENGWAREAEERAETAGIALTTLAAEESPDTRRKLWQLSLITDRDIPFDTVHADEPFERFEAMIDSPLCMHDCLVIAKDGDVYAGFSITAKQKADRAFTWSTGVHPEYRGRGVARAMKVYAASLARKKGFTAMRTFNHVNNPAMLAVNVGMGYKPLPEVIFFLKQL